MKKTLTILALATLAFTACKKDDDTTTNKFAGFWVLEKGEYFKNDVLVEVDSLPQTLRLSECGKNTFCDGSISVQAFSFAIKYKINNDETIMTIDDDGDLSTTDDHTEYQIQSISNSQFIYFNTYVDSGISYKDVFYMKKQ